LTSQLNKGSLNEEERKLKDELPLMDETEMSSQEQSLPVIETTLNSNHVLDFSHLRTAAEVDLQHSIHETNIARFTRLTSTKIHA
jgi:hypothetical protein